MTPQIDYDNFVNLQRALCAATGCDISYLAEVVWPWVCTQTVARGNGPRTEERGIEWLEEKWRGFKTSELGAHYIYHVAATFGFTEGMKEIQDDWLIKLYGEPTQAAVTDPSSSSSLSPPSGPLPPSDADEHLIESFIASDPPFRYITDRKDPYEAWVTLKSGVWVPDYPGVCKAVRKHCSAVGDRLRTTGGPGGAALDKSLKSSITHERIVRTGQRTPELTVGLDQFDQDHWLFNTPAGVFDIRTKKMRPHTLDDMMLMQAKVAPQLAAQGLYNIFCPRWLEYIDFLASSGGDRADEYAALLRRYGAYQLTGYAKDLYMLFMWGEINSGKSAFQDVLAALIASYGAPLSEGFLLKQLNKRTFELSQLRGRRAAFAGEVPKNSTWDTLTISTMLNGSRPLSAEGKNVRFRYFVNTAKILVAGNHRPNFVSSSEKDGLDRRFLMLEFTHDIIERFVDDRDWSTHVLEAEGPGILMWFLEEAHRGYKDLVETGSFMGGTQKIGLEIAAQHRLKLNPHVQWIDQDLVCEPEAKTRLKELWERYKEWGGRNQLWRAGKVETMEEFESAMVRVLKFRVERPTNHQHGMAKWVYGLRPKNFAEIENQLGTEKDD